MKIEATMETIRESIETNSIANLEFGNGQRATLLKDVDTGEWIVQGRGTLGNDSKLEWLLTQYESKFGKTTLYR